jgi:hypothetical protein
MTEEHEPVAPAPPWRRRAAMVLAPLAAVMMLVALVTNYANRVLFDSDRFGDHVVHALDRDVVKDEVARLITEDLVIAGKRDLVGFQPLIEGGASEIVGGEVFQDLVRAAAVDLHKALFGREKDSVALTVGDVATVVASAIESSNPKLAKQLGTDDVRIEIEPPQYAVTISRVAEEVKSLHLVLIAIAIALTVAAVWISPQRRRTLIVLAISLAVGAFVLIVAYQLGRDALLGRISDADARAAIGGVWDAFLVDLRSALLITAAGSLVLVAALAHPLRPAVIEGTMRRAWRLVATTPERPLARGARAVALIAAGIVMIAARDFVLDLVVLAAGLLVLYVGVEEALRLIAPPPEPGAPAAAREPRRRLVAQGAVGAILALGVIGFLLTEPGRAPPREQGLCNGSAALCERTLDEVAIPATHNAMSAAGQTDYLFAQQDKPIPQQLKDGVRGFLIDAHYGAEGTSGAVKTDLSGIPGGEREEYAGSLGEEGLDAALRVRDRIAGEVTKEPRVYLCHRFCELGALDAEKTLSEMREFLTLHRGAVLVISVEDYVAPQAFMDVVESSGLGEYLYKGPIEAGVSPTLGELVESNKRVVLMAESKGGKIDGYRDAYGGLLQETPYSFKKVPALTRRDRLAQSCEPNRGDDEAPLFLLNHWIDTSPAAKPSNAAKVNAAKPLLARIHRCAEQRDATVNMVAVDFYDTGDLLEVTEKLNAGG